MSIVEYVSIGGIVLSVISFIVTTIFSKSKNKSTTERTKKLITLISEIVPKAITYAEKNGNSGENKKVLALSKILLDCTSNKIDYEEQATAIDETIENLITFSKEVNAVNVAKKV